MQLHGHRMPNVLRRGHRLPCGFGDPRLDGRNAVGRQQLFRGVLRHQHAARLVGGLYDLGGRLAVGEARLVLRQAGRLVEGAQVVAVAPHMVEHARRGVRVREGGQAALVQDVLAGGHRVAPHPAGQDGLVVVAGVGAQVLRRLGGLGHGLRREDDQQAVAVFVVGGHLQRLCVAFRIGVS